MLTFPPRENLFILLQDRLFTYEHYLPWCVHRANSLHLVNTEMKLNEITKESQEEKIGEVDVFCATTFLHLLVWQSPKFEVLRNAFPRPLLEIASFAPCASFSWLCQVEKKWISNPCCLMFHFSWSGHPSWFQCKVQCNILVALWISSLPSVLRSLAEESFDFITISYRPCPRKYSVRSH